MKLRNSILVSVLIFIPILNSPAAQAHATLVRTFPTKGAIVLTSTNRVSMLFGEYILVLQGRNPNTISVINQKGTVVSTGVPMVSGKKIWQSLKTPLQAGRYTVKYRVVSADGHVVSGTYTFTVK